jgi:predicted enzyme related to lactoylglutathione lyase
LIARFIPDTKGLSFGEVEERCSTGTDKRHEDRRMSAAWGGVTIDCVDAEGTARFWATLLDVDPHRAGPDRAGWYRIAPLVPGGPVLNFQPVGERKAGKVRIHLDLWVDDLDAASRQVEQLGGSSTWERQVYVGRGTVVVAGDPEGHEFCLVSGEGA